jgi:hypothetical protein
VPHEVRRTRKPIASLSLDLDDRWVYLRTAGERTVRYPFVDLMTVIATRR